MKILVSNDDGIAANGIRCLTETLAQQHEVYVIAPDRERSAALGNITKFYRWFSLFKPYSSLKKGSDICVSPYLNAMWYTELFQFSNFRSKE